MINSILSKESSAPLSLLRSHVPLLTPTTFPSPPPPQSLPPSLLILIKIGQFIIRPLFFFFFFFSHFVAVSVPHAETPAINLNALYGKQCGARENTANRLIIIKHSYSGSVRVFFSLT